MDSKFISRQEKLLLKQKENLEKDLFQIARKKKTGEKYEAKFMDFGQRDDERAFEVTTYEEYIALERNLSKILAEVKKALKRIKKGQYTICEVCKKEIDINRLKASPTASLCLECAKKPKKQFRWAFWRKG